MLARLALLALSIAATDAFAQTTAASPSTDYGNPQAWLCRPDRPGACDVDLSTTVLGRDAGGTFAHMPLCRAATQTGCVVAYSSFRVTAPPAANTRFGRSDDSTLVAACTNPAALGGGEAALNGYFDAAGGTALPLGKWPWAI